MSRPPHRRRTNPLADAVSEITEVLTNEWRFRNAGRSAADYERPIDVISEFVGTVATSLAESIPSVRYSTSRRTISVKRGDLTFRYPFQASRRNSGGVSINVLPHASVSSTTLRAWRKANGSTNRYLEKTGDFVFGMLGNFFVPHEYISLQLLDHDRRARELGRVVQLIVEADERLSSRFADFDSFAQYAAEPTSEIVCQGNNACEYVAAVWGIERVQALIRRVVAERPNGDAELAHYLGQLRANSHSVLPMKPLAGCAQFITKYGALQD